MSIMDIWSVIARLSAASVNVTYSWLCREEVHLMDDKTGGHLEIGIDGMTCASCSARVERALGKLPGVTSANVNLATERAEVLFDPQQLDAARIAEAIRESGYTPAEVLPQDKAKVVTQLQEQCRRVAFIGDGINDAPALAQANVGIALASGTDIVIEAADVTLSRRQLGEVVTALTAARRTLSNIRGNLFWAFFYNILLIPVAAGVAAPIGIHLNPMVAGVAMGLSSVFVLSNSLPLKRLKAYVPTVTPGAVQNTALEPAHS